MLPVIFKSAKLIVAKALFDSYLASEAEVKIEEWLNSLTRTGTNADILFKGPPTITILATDDKTITLLVRGRFTFPREGLDQRDIRPFGAVGSLFVRIEAVISKDIHLNGSLVPDESAIVVKEWRTVGGDLEIEKELLFNCHAAFIADKDDDSGEDFLIFRGSIKLKPGGFGLDLLGGASNRGFIFSADVSKGIPLSIPLGPTGLGLQINGGDYAHNFVPRLEQGGVPIEDPTAAHYVKWAYETEKIDRWVPGPVNETVDGIGIRFNLVTLPDNGFVLKLSPAGLSFFTHGPVIILGGKGIIFSRENIKVEGYAAIDLASGSFSLGLRANFEVESPTKALGKLRVLKGDGAIDSLFSYKDPSIWYINIGTKASPMRMSTEIDKALWIYGDVKGLPKPSVEAYLQINNNRILLGSKMSIDFGGKIAIIAIKAAMRAEVEAEIGWNPFLLRGMFSIGGELGIEVFGSKFLITVNAQAIGHMPEPLYLKFLLRVSLELPWPIPNPPPIELPLTIGDEEPMAPNLNPPLLAGKVKFDGNTRSLPNQLHALHSISGRQWELDKESPWPDVDIVVPFTQRVSDKTNTVIGPVINSEIQGGYEVAHEIDKIELFDLTNNVQVTDVKGVWSAGPGGNCANLHILGQDPFSWLIPHIEAVEAAYEDPPRIVEQLFGHGHYENLGMAETRFGQIIVVPLSSELSVTPFFDPVWPLRVLMCDRFKLLFRTHANEPIYVDQISLYLYRYAGMAINFELASDSITTSEEVWRHYPEDESSIIRITLTLTQPVNEIKIEVDNVCILFAVRYRIVGKTSTEWKEKKILLPGRYRIVLEGKSEAKHIREPEPQINFPGKEISWSLQQEFDVKYPETIRPYIKYTTMGDNRLFHERNSWNPTDHGVGFPSYKKYFGVVRFLVPYIDKIFPNIKLRLAYESNVEIIETIATPVASPDGLSSYPDNGQAWITAMGGFVHSDKEISFSRTFSNSGPATVSLLFNTPQGEEVQLDQWSCYISRYDSFTKHVSWSEYSIKDYYDLEGKKMYGSCPSLRPPARRHQTVTGTILHIMTNNNSNDGNNNNNPAVMASTANIAERRHTTPLQYPHELKSAPIDWLIPNAVAIHLITPLRSPSAHSFDRETGVRFSRFAYETGVRFNTGEGDRLHGINENVERTNIEGICDQNGRLYALWLRSAEPIDWRRVSASLVIRHIVVDNGKCPTGYAYRRPLDLKMGIMPSLDGSSAFLVGYFSNRPVFLPRGEYELTLTFDPYLPDLPKLKPSNTLGTGVEVAKLIFVQPLGKDWPLPTDAVDIPRRLFELLMRDHPLQPETLWDIYDGTITNEKLEQILFSENT